MANERSMKALEEKTGKNWVMYRGDCIQVLKGIPDDSIGLSIFSPPFSNLYAYSDDDADLGNCKSYEEFFTHFGFLVDELQRVTMPGRLVAVHCMDLPTFKNKEGYIGLREFPDDIIKCFKKRDFIFSSRHCIWKDPLIAATRTHALNLAHGQLIKDSAKSGMGSADYIVAFTKKGENPKPIAHPMGLTEYPGEEPIPRDLSRYVGWEDQRTNKRSHWIWQRIASPVWMDVRQTRVLPYKQGRDQDDEKHICPLQKDVVERCLILWSNPGDIVLDPFGGIGTTAYIAVEMSRKAISIELKKSYFRQAVRNLESLKYKQDVSLESRI